MPPIPSSRPLLLLDCYLSTDGCPARFTPPGDVRTDVVQPPHVSPRALDLDVGNYRGVVITGSAASVLDEAPWSLAVEGLVRDAHRTNTPLFGVCYGHQLIAKSLFGADQVRRSSTPEFGWHEIQVTAAEGPVATTPDSFLCFVSHYDEVAPALSESMLVLAHSDRCCVQAFRIANKPVWGVQFHAEMAFDEASSIFRERVANSPELGIDAKAQLESATPTAELWKSIYGSFLDSLPA
jgi:GMP synthase (glutamine-hydrolysing)